jgi:hypothetical protein
MIGGQCRGQGGVDFSAIIKMLAAQARVVTIWRIFYDAARQHLSSSG